MSSASVTGARVNRRAARHARSSAAATAARAARRRRGSGRCDLPVLEVPQHDVAEADEQQDEADPVRRAVVEHPVEREREADGAQEHALAQVRPRRPCGAASFACSVERRARSGRHCIGRRARRRSRLHASAGGTTPFSARLQHRLVLHPRLAHLVPDDERDDQDRGQEHEERRRRTPGPAIHGAGRRTGRTSRTRASRRRRSRARGRSCRRPSRRPSRRASRRFPGLRRRWARPAALGRLGRPSGAASVAAIRDRRPATGERLRRPRRDQVAARTASAPGGEPRRSRAARPAPQHQAADGGRQQTSHEISGMARCGGWMRRRRRSGFAAGRPPAGGTPGKAGHAIIGRARRSR